MDKSIKKLGEVLKQNSENATLLELAKENTNPALEKNQAQLVVIYGTSFEHTLEKMKTASNFFEIEERPNGDMFWNRTRV